MAMIELSTGLPIDWDSKHALALLIGAQLASTGANISYDYTGSLDRYVDSLLTAHTTSTGLLWFSGSSDEASLVAAINSAYLLTAYADLFPSSSRSTDALSLACKQLDYVLGSNPKGTIYITGVSPAHSPKNPQSAMASGGSPDGDIDTEPLKEKYRLFGAMVGGPDEQDRFKDQRSNYRQSEVALDYNALLTPLCVLRCCSLCRLWAAVLIIGAPDSRERLRMEACRSSRDSKGEGQEVDESV